MDVKEKVAAIKTAVALPKGGNTSPELVRSAYTMLSFLAGFMLSAARLLGSGSPFGGPFPGNGRQRPGNEDGQSSATPKGDDQPPANVDAVPSEGCACPSGSCGCIDNGGCACPFQTVG